MKTIAAFFMVLLVSCAPVATQQTTSVGQQSTSVGQQSTSVGQQSTSVGQQSTSVERAAKLIATQSELQVLDVRRPDEYKSGHLANATLVTWGEPDFEKQALAKLSKDKPVMVYCRSGRRSTAATEALTGLGFKKLHNLEGGITAWQAAGKPVVK